MIDLKKLTETQFTKHLQDVLAEQQRRRALPHVEQAQAEVVKELQDAGKLPLPDALTDADHLPEDVDDIPHWTDPGTDHSAMYRQGDIVSHDDRVWQSTHPHLNHWEPGAPGIDARIWKDITPQPQEEPEEPVTDDQADTTERPEEAETHAPEYSDNRSYQLGDQVTYNGNTYECTKEHFAAPGWTPLNAHAMWKKAN